MTKTCRTSCGCDRRRAADAGGGPVRDGAGHDGDEHGDRDGRQGSRHDGDRDPDGDHAVHAGDGVADDHRRQGRRDHRPQARVHDRLRRLRLRVADDGAVAEPDGADDRLVGPGGPRRGADHARDRGAGRVELRQARAPARLRARRRRRRDRRRARPADRRLLHDLRLVAVGVRRRGADRRGDPRARPPRERHAGRGGRQARPVRHRPVGARPGPDRVRHPEVRDLGRRAAQARGPAVDRPLAGDLAAARRRRRPGAVPALGEPAHRARRGRADQPQAAAQRPDALRGALVPVHVPRAGGDVLRRAAVPVGRARAVGDRDRRAAAADVADAAAVRRRGPEAAARTPTRGASSTPGSC